MKPIRIQLARAKGFRLQEWSRELNGLPAVNVARPSRWGNPYKVGDPAWDPVTGRSIGRLDLAGVIEKFRRLECGPTRSAEIVHSLRGKNLACWCPLCEPCHADVLLEIANAEPARLATSRGLFSKAAGG